ncbi:hypothetical protein BdWA1_001751 [Babesia duncani]|uniref:Uncharacterized protein n=1 Tax=Babesia duncani TaxID=323732 RepID=A0AAD9PKQ3_9APIC|nr:hypothetical protein BdWA1_001751 [Babesia duncani]
MFGFVKTKPDSNSFVRKSILEFNICMMALFSTTRAGVPLMVTISSKGSTVLGSQSCMSYANPLQPFLTRQTFINCEAGNTSE